MATIKQKHRESVLKALGESIRQARIKKKMTQEQLANAADLHRTYVTDIENGMRNLSFMTLLRVCRALDRPLSKTILVAESIDGWSN